MGLVTEIKALRVLIASLKREQAMLSGQIRSRAEVAAYVERYIGNCQRDAQEANRRTLNALACGHALLLHADVSDGNGQVPSTADLGPMLVEMLGADKVASVLLSELDTVPEGLPQADRLARLEAIAAELHEIEVEEEGLICESEAEGVPVPRRRDARPEIVLGTPDAPPLRSPNADVFEPARERERAKVASSPYLGTSRP